MLQMDQQCKKSTEIEEKQKEKKKKKVEGTCSKHDNQWCFFNFSIPNGHANISNMVKKKKLTQNYL
jgi:hypothetical protein